MTTETKSVCGKCSMMQGKLCDGTKCFSLQKDLEHSYELPAELPQTYGNGRRFTADAMDCALPISLDAHSGCSYSCIAHGTMILMADGTQKPIQDITIGELVWSYQIDENDRVVKEEAGVVQKIAKKWASNIMSIAHDYGTRAVRLTPDHKVFTTKGWKEASSLEAGDEILRVWKGNTIDKKHIVKKDMAVLRSKKKGPRPPLSEHERHVARKRMQNKNPMRLKKNRIKVSKTMTAQFASGERKPGFRYGMGNYSDGQRMLYEILDKMGLAYKKEYSIKATQGCPNKSRVFLDAAIPDQKIAIEYDGWPYHSWEKTKEKDAQRDAWLKLNGWTVVRIAGDDIQDEELVREELACVQLQNHRKFKKLKRIKFYDTPLGNGGDPAYKKKDWVYDLQISPNHNFVAGGMLVSNCLYCFSNNLMRAPDRNKTTMQKIIREGSFYSEWPIGKLERFLARDLNDPVSKAMYPLMDAGCPMQCGALGDPFDDLEAHSQWIKKAVPLFIKYQQPIRFSTKGADVLARPDYLKLFENNPEQFWFAFSIISNSDKLIEAVDIKAPNTTARLKAMKAVTDLGCHASLRFRPFIPGISDSYKGEPKGWAKLIERSKKSGAEAVSFEYIFLNPAPTPRQKEMYRLMFRAIGNPNFGEEWHGMSNKQESCRRGSREFKYQMTKDVRDLCHKIGLTFGCSDPHFKEWNDVGNCCGLPADDPWFGHWSRRQMTEICVQGRLANERGEDYLVTYDDWRPEWAHQVKVAALVSLSSWHAHRVKKHVSFGDHLRSKWNNPKHPRAPFKYFGGLLVPVGVTSDTNDVVYKYEPWDHSWDKKFKGVRSDG